MTKVPLIGGELLVCEHAGKWIKTAAIVFDITEREVIERCLNSYVHGWHELFEAPLNQSHTTLATSIRNSVFRGGRNHDR